MFYSRNTPKFAQKRHYPRGESDETYFCQDPDVNPILKKNKLFNSFPNTNKFSDMNGQNTPPITYTYNSGRNHGFNSNFNMNKPHFGNQIYNNGMRETFQPSKFHGGFIEEERIDKEAEKRKWIEERKRIAESGLMGMKQQQKGFENINYTFCD